MYSVIICFAGVSKVIELTVASGVIAIGWQTYLSLLNQRAANAVAAEQTEQTEPIHTSSTLRNAETAQA